MRILIVKPVGPASSELRTGNDVTAERWARLLRELGHQLAVAPAFNDQPCDLLVTLHARKSAASALRLHEERPDTPLVVALTGTDIYGDLDDAEELRVLEIADILVELQPLANLELPGELRTKVRTVLQSAERVAERGSLRSDRFDVCTIAHLREVKDPFRTAEAARLLPDGSLLHVLHVGGAFSPEMEARARDEEHANSRYNWLGGRNGQDTARLLTSCRLLSITSHSEGGANVISEALVNDVPVLASRIPGSIGLLGEDYPGYFPPGDTTALARLLWRSESEPAFLGRLRDCCRFRAAQFDPAREREAWRSLLEELDRRKPE